ncbi:MAG TPA: chemotaxis protein CheR [Cyanobacteria bacterium UBA11049]|nr:chemotaxis protein CheR [Cyanobacteria bacterium UBA11049]
MSIAEPNPEFENLLTYLKRNRGFDFTGYKRSSLVRRVQKRMQSLNIASFSEYMDYLAVNPNEFVSLFNTILINVTSFFRDRCTWEYIASEIIPQIVVRKGLNDQIRVWSAGCASGQEAYTLAIVLAEALGLEQFKSRVKIYATDIDEEALNQARYANYCIREVASVPEELLEKYFEHSNNVYTFHKDLRRAVIFGRHDLLKDAPISRVDLIVCRNSIMYFNAEAQSKIIARFHFALNDGGFLFLGKAEMLLTHSNIFHPVDLKQRIFTKVGKFNPRDRLVLMSNNGEDNEDNYISSHEQIRDAAFDANPVAQVVVDVNGLLILANERSCILFNINPKDIGRPLQDLESYLPLELDSCIERVYRDRRTAIQNEVEWTNSSRESLYFDIKFAPLLDFDGKLLLGVSITFADVTRSKKLQEELAHSNQELEMAYEELQSTNEELETTNEELQSSNEELETTNEELQSTNEELETMNEELQSSNEELQTINEELRLSGEELNKANSFLESILGSLRGGVVVVNRELQILIWNGKAEDIWGLRASEVLGQNFLNLDIGLAVERLREPIRTCMTEEPQAIEVTLPATNRRGKSILCKVTCTPLIGRRKEIQGAIVLMEQVADSE